mmetsp:Transcript_11213/g.52034  ORF Transcript_11213/g.52034 Transcript_11213/m.52034 type:complete len:206 (-) Transcript_11213:5459-6076(-)
MASVPRRPQRRPGIRSRFKSVTSNRAMRSQRRWLARRHGRLLRDVAAVVGGERRGSRRRNRSSEPVKRFNRCGRRRQRYWSIRIRGRPAAVVVRDRRAERGGTRVGPRAGSHRRRRGRQGSYRQLRPRREPDIAAASVRAGRAGERGVRGTDACVVRERREAGRGGCRGAGDVPARVCDEHRQERGRRVNGQGCFCWLYFRRLRY